MGDEKSTGRIVEFGAKMTAASSFQTTPPAQKATQEADRLSPEELARGTKGGQILMRILSMSVGEKQAHVVTQVHDPLLMWFSFLTPEERREFLKAAETHFREKLMG